MVAGKIGASPTPGAMIWARAATWAMACQYPLAAAPDAGLFGNGGPDHLVEALLLLVAPQGAAVGNAEEGVADGGGGDEGFFADGAACFHALAFEGVALAVTVGPGLAMEGIVLRVRGYDHVVGVVYGLCAEPEGDLLGVRVRGLARGVLV